MDTYELNSFRAAPRTPLFDEISESAKRWFQSTSAFQYHHIANAEAHVARATSASAIFTYYCSPRSAPSEVLVALSEFVAIFFYLDDLPHTANMTANEWLDFHKSLMAAIEQPHREAPDQTPFSAISRWLRAFIDRTTSSPTPQHAFLVAFRDYCVSLKTETENENTNSNITVEQYWVLRRDTVFFLPYATCLQALLGITVPGDDAGAAEELLEVATRIICMINDLGSLERDQADGDLNLALVLANHHNIAVSDARQLVRRTHDEAAESFRRRASALRRRSSEPATEQFVDLLESIIDGHLRATREYRARFKGSSDILGDVEPVARRGR